MSFLPHKPRPSPDALSALTISQSITWQSSRWRRHISSSPSKSNSKKALNSCEILSFLFENWNSVIGDTCLLDRLHVLGFHPEWMSEVWDWFTRVVTGCVCGRCIISFFSLLAAIFVISSKRLWRWGSHCGKGLMRLEKKTLKAFLLKSFHMIK